MLDTNDEVASIVERRLDRSWNDGKCHWEHFYQPRQERMPFATRYHLVYPALAYFIEMKRKPDTADHYRPILEAMYRGLVDSRSWSYWHTEIGETTWPLQERNLTYSGRLATFIGFFIDAFGEPPTDRIEAKCSDSQS